MASHSKIHEIGLEYQPCTSKNLLAKNCAVHNLTTFELSNYCQLVSVAYVTSHFLEV